MAACACPPTGWPNPDCPTHGLPPGKAWPPMDRHRLDGEDARDAQRRLYLESRGLRECCVCGRVGARGFRETFPTVADLERSRTDRRWQCRGEDACRRREAARARSYARQPVEDVAAEVRGHRFVYGDEDALQAALAGLLGRRWRVRREVDIGGGRRLDLWLPGPRVAVEAKIAGAAGDVRRQVERYLECPDVRGLVLVTSRARHGLPRELAGKPVEVVSLLAAAL